MRVLIATPLYPPDPGGPATYARLLETGLPNKDIEVSLVAFTRVRRYPKVLRHALYAALLLVAARKADIIYALDPVSVGVPAAFVALLLRKPLVLKVVGDYAWEQGRQRFGITESLDRFVEAEVLPLEARILQKVEAWVARRAKRIIVPSEYLRSIVSTWEGVNPEHLIVIYNAMQEEAAVELPPAVAMVPHPRIVSVGRLVPWKQFEGVIDAVGRLEPASLIIVGDGPSRERLERRAEETAADRILFTGALAHAETLAIMREADMFVLNSTYEGFSHLLIEALSLGVPTIATAVGGNPELVRHEENGLLIPARDTDALAEAIERLLGDGALRARVSAHARESARAFSAEAMIDRTSALLRTCV